MALISDFVSHITVYYKFDGSTTNILDATSKNYDLTPSSATTALTVAGKVGNLLKGRIRDGLHGPFNRANPEGDFHLGDGGMITFWANIRNAFNPPGPNLMIYLFEDNDDEKTWWSIDSRPETVIAHSGMAYAFNLYDLGQTVERLTIAGSGVSGGQIGPDEWHFIAAGFDGGSGINPSGTMYLRVDDASAQSAVSIVPIGATAPKNGQSFSIFGNSSASGIIYDDVVFWDRVLINSELDAIYNGGTGQTVECFGGSDVAAVARFDRKCNQAGAATNQGSKNFTKANNDLTTNGQIFVDRMSGRLEDNNRIG